MLSSKAGNRILRIIVLLPLVVLLSTTACEDVSEELAGIEVEGADTLSITMIAKSLANPVFVSAKKGALEAAQSFSEENSMLHVTIDWRTPPTEDASEQTERIRNAVQEGTNAILVSCSDRDSLTVAINEAVEAGVPVMTFDSDAPGSKRFAYYGADDRKMGKTIAGRLAELLDGKGKIAVLGGNITAPNLQERVNGIVDSAAAYPGIEIVGVYYHPENEADAVAMMDSVQRLHPDLAGWAMAGGWPMFGDMLLDRMEPGKIKIVAVDALPVQLKYVEKNYAQVLLGQPTFRWGKISVETVVAKLHENEEVDEILELNPIPVTIENMGGWSRQLRAWGYTNLPEKYLLM